MYKRQDVCRKVLENGATFLQIREKDLDENTFEQEAEALKELCASYRVPYVVNDSVELSLIHIYSYTDNYAKLDWTILVQE